MSGPRGPYGPGAEFELIRRLTELDGDLPPEVRIGPGDDAAVLEGGWIVSTDLTVEDVHFRRAWITDREVGYRAATAALSDMAAMGAGPVGVLVSIAAPRGGAVDVEAVQAGIVDAARAVGAAVSRDGAEAGDHVWVTGSLGAAAAAVRAWEAGEEPAPALRSAFVKPIARVSEARCLVEHEIVDAMIDVSDGLVGDVGHIAAASGVKIVLDLVDIPVAEAARDVLGAEAALESALTGGEDYELCFITDPGIVDPGYFLGRYGVSVTRVGSVSDGDGVWLRGEDGTVTQVTAGGFDHWEAPAGPGEEGG
jgi:thiamine-monophosphate kinase